MGIGRFAFTPVLPMMRHEGALSITDAAWLAFANYAGYLAGAILALLISMPTYRGIRWGLVIICLGTIAMGFVQTLSGWMVLRAVTGIGSAWVLIFVSAWCSRPLEACRTASFKRRRFCRSRSRDSGDRLALPCLHECENDLYASLGRSRLIGHSLDGAHLAGYSRHPEERTRAAERSEMELGGKSLDPLLRSFRLQLYHPGYLLTGNGTTNRF